MNEAVAGDVLSITGCEAERASRAPAACLVHGFSDPSRLVILRHLALDPHRLGLTGDAVALCPRYGSARDGGGPG